MKNKNIFILLLTLFTSFSVGDLTHADLDSSQVLGEMPGYFFMDDEFGDDVYVGYARYPDDYTLLNYFDKENYTNIFFDIPISNQYTLSTLGICQISGGCNKDSYFNPYIAQITQTLDDYNIYSISLSNVNKGSNYWGNGDLMKLSFTDNSSMVFKFLIPHDTVFDGILNTYISDYYYDDSSYGYIDLFLLEDDRRLNLAADMEVELVDDNFQLSNLNYPINKSYLLVRDNIVDDDIKNEYTYSLDGNNVSIEIPNYDEDEYGFGVYDLSQVRNIYIPEFNSYFFNRYDLFSPKNICNTLRDEVNDISIKYGVFPLDDIDGWSHIEDGVDDFVLNFNLITSTYGDGSSIKFKPKFYKVDTDYNIDADPLDEVSYDLNISRRWDNYLQGYPIGIKNIEGLDDGVYKVVLSDFEYGDIEICKLAYDMDIDINISPKDDFKDIYTINNGELELFYGNFTKNISQFVSHEDILNMGSEGIAINEMAVNLSVFEEFQITISSLDGNDIIYIDKDDGFENYGSSFYGEYLSGDKLDEIYNITTDDGVNSGNLYIFNYHTIDNSDYRDEFNVIGYIDASYNTYFHPLNPADIIYTMMGDRDDFSLDLIDNIEIRDLEDGIIYPCLGEDNCTIYDAIDNSEYDGSTLKIYLKLKDYNQVLNFYFTPFIYDSSPSLDIYDNLDYIRYATSYYKSYDFTPRIIDRLPINYYDLDDGGIDSFKIGFYDELGNEIYSIDNLDDLDSKYINYGDSKVYLKGQSRLDFINTLKNYKDQYIYYTLNLNFVFQDYPESDGVLYYDGKYFNSSGYFSSLFAALFDKTLDLSYLHDITDVCDEYDDGCGLDNIDYYGINSFTNSQTPNLAPFINQLQSDDLYFSKLYDFKIPDGDLSFDGLWVDDIELLDESDNNINFDPSKILICQIPIDSFVSPKGCMTYKDIKKLGILIPSETIFIYGLKSDLIGGYTEEIKVNIRIDIYGTIQLITPR